MRTHGETTNRPGARLAALDAGAWWIEGEPRHERAHPLRSIASLFTIMDAREVAVLYVHRSALATLGLPDELEVPRPGERAPRHKFLAAKYEGVEPSRRALAPSIELPAGDRPRGGKRPRLEVMIGAYQDGAGDPFADARDGGELLAAAIAYADALGELGRRWALRNSIAVTGWNLMHAPYGPGGRRRTRPLDGAENPQPELAGVADGAQVEVPFGSWATTGGAGFPQLPYVAAWDINGQRLAACSRLALGVGGLEHFKHPPRLHPDDWRETFAKAPGYHLVKSVLTPHAGVIPPIFAPGWHTTPRVAMAHYLGLEPEVRESWLWREHVPYLDPFYDRLRKAREQLLAQADYDHAAATPARVAASIALGALKQTYLQPLGRLRSGKLRERRDVRYRPSWYDAVIGQELARQYMRLHQLADAGERVLAIYFDAIVCEVPAPDYTPPALELSPQLGKWKRVGVLPTADALSVLYAGDSPDVGALVKALKAGGDTPHGGERKGSTPPALSAFTRPAHGGYPVPA